MDSKFALMKDLGNPQMITELRQTIIGVMEEAGNHSCDIASLLSMPSLFSTAVLTVSRYSIYCRIVLNPLADIKSSIIFYCKIVVAQFIVLD
jgi:hypothetical protein